MNIMFIIPSLNGGGAERVVARLASEFCKEHVVHVIIWPKGLRHGVYPHDERVMIRELSPNPISDTPLRRVPGLASSIRWREIRELKKHLDIDVSVSFLTPTNHDNVMSHANERTIISVRNMVSRSIPENRYSALMEIGRIRRAGCLADGLVAVSKRVGIEQVEQYGVKPEKITTIYNPVDAESIRALACEQVNDPAFERFCERHDRIILTTGRLEQQKGHWHLVRAFAQIATEHNAGLVILGQGNYEGLLDEVIHANRIGDHVLLAGFHPNPFPYMARADVFVLPSLFEGFSNALLEAMACGLPLVAADCDSGPRELFAPETDVRTKAVSVVRTEYGLLTPVCSGNADLRDEPLEPAEQHLANALDMALSDEELRNALRASSAKRIEDFSMEKIASQWAQVMGIPYTGG